MLKRIAKWDLRLTELAKKEEKKDRLKFKLKGITGWDLKLTEPKKDKDKVLVKEDCQIDLRLTK